MPLTGDWAEVVDHLNSATDRGGQLMNLKVILVRACVTFVQVAISVLIGTGAIDVSASVAQTAVMSGAGAALSVVYNAATQWLAKQPV